MNVLVPIDGSDPSMAALEYACTEHGDAAITALYVSNVSSGQNRFIAGGSFREWKAIEDNRAEELLESARDHAETVGVDLETAHDFGDPLRDIVAYAEDNDFDLIVIGSHGRDGISRLALGSVAERVIRLASMPVVV